ncbi:MAG: hypothetical protein WCK34_06860 [Bacteroidota bacterium]
MNKEIIKDEIRWLLEAINEQYEVISQHGDRIPQIEFDILMENLRKFYENLQVLKRLDDPHFSYERKVQPREMPKPAPQAPGEQVVPKPAPPSPVPARPPQSFYKPAAVAVKQEPQPFSKKQSKPDEITLFAIEEPPMDTKLKEARERAFSPKIPPERIENLKAAIIINDKFMFINELFEGNLREYNETIETLNGFKTIDQAADYLDLMRKKNFWNTGSPAFKRLKELVERRF